MISHFVVISFVVNTADALTVLNTHFTTNENTELHDNRCRISTRSKQQINFKCIQPKAKFETEF